MSLPNLQVLEGKQVQVSGLTGKRLSRGEKIIFEETGGTRWMLSLASATNLNSYIISGLYKLILGEMAPQEQLFRASNGDVYPSLFKFLVRQPQSLTVVTFLRLLCAASTLPSS